MAKALNSRRANKRSRNEVKQIIHDAFRRRFPRDTVDVSDGYEDNIHVVVVSREFDQMEEQQKLDLMWRIIDKSQLTKEEKGLISLVYPVSLAEIK